MNHLTVTHIPDPIARGTSESSDVDSLTAKRIAVVSYPTLFQVSGGMAMKVRQTVRALRTIGVDARLANLVEESISDFDLVHVFGAFNCNHRFVTVAQGLHKPVVVSPVLMPPFSENDGRLARFIDRVTGKLTGWSLSTSYGQIRSALDGADMLLALGSGEREMLLKGYGQPESKIVIVPNGVGEQFFTATPELFLKTFGISRPVVLHVGIIGEVKNQLGLVRALQDDELEVVLVGPCSNLDRRYLEQCIKEGHGRVRYLGEFPHGDEMLTSAYAAAAVLAVPSKFEGMSNCVLEALAAGTPVVTTKHHSWDFRADESAVIEVDPTNPREIRDAVLKLLQGPKPRAQCQAIVSPLSWKSVALRVAKAYAKLIAADIRV